MSANGKTGPQQVVIELGQADDSCGLFAATISLASLYNSAEANQILEHACATIPALSLQADVYGTDLVVIGDTVAAVQETVHLIASIFEVTVETIYTHPAPPPVAQVAAANMMFFFGSGCAITEDAPPEG